MLTGVITAPILLGFLIHAMSIGMVESGLYYPYRFSTDDNANPLIDSLSFKYDKYKKRQLLILTGIRQQVYYAIAASVALQHYMACGSSFCQ
jgi:hypothetical protein